MTTSAASGAGDRPSRDLPERLDGPRACGPIDLAAAVDLVNHVFCGPPAATMGPARPPTIGWSYGFVYHPDNLENLRVFRHRGRVVSLVAIHPSEVRTAHGSVRVGGVCGVATHPEYRRLGLSTALLRDAAAHMRTHGRHIGLLGTSLHHFYRKLGWERAGQMHTFTLDRRTVELLPGTQTVEATEDWRPHVAALCALHNGRLPAAVRSPDTMVALLERRASRIVAGLCGGEAVAYVALRDAVVREHAGTAEDVAALLRHAFAALDAPASATSDRRQSAVELSVVTPVLRPDGAEHAAGSGLAALLSRTGIPCSTGYIGMAALLDPPALFATLGLDRVVDLERLPTSPDHTGACWRLHRRGKTLVLDERDLAKLLFGPERWPDFAPDLFPVDFFQWPVDRV